MNALEVKKISKKYPKFFLSDVSFDVKEKSIMGFIGRNGAGKTTTLKCLINLVHSDSGEVLFFEKKFSDNELEIKQKIGFVTGGISYYSASKLKDITKVNRKFYDEWDNTAYKSYLEMFSLDEEKTPSQLSEGMKVKYSLALALSHNAKLLILDEPTSGLDPVSRDELLDIFLDLVKNNEISILFSTHITSDLDKCADYITYIQNGKIIKTCQTENFISEYKMISFDTESEAEPIKDKLIGLKNSRTGLEALIKTSDLPVSSSNVKDADLEQIMVHLERK